MKKIFALLLIAFALTAVSCQKNPVEHTAAVEMAGQWYVTCDGFAGGAVKYEDVFGMGQFRVYTSNTSANVATEMLLSDDRDNPFWDFKVKITADPAALTFSSSASADNLNYDCKVTVTGGKIVKNGATTPSGMPADYIEFHVVFSDDDYAGSVYDDLYFHGYRYTGFAADE